VEWLALVLWTHEIYLWSRDLVTRNWAAIADDRTSRLYLPPGYRLEYDPDVLRLVRGSNGSVVAAFSVGGLTLAEVVRAAEEDYRANGRSTA
jgi:hypothetical protein